MDFTFIDHDIIISQTGGIINYLSADEAVFGLKNGIVPEKRLGVGKVNGFRHAGMQNGILLA